MAETNNNFTGARMNKDIDDRLIANNEYRNAVNLEISRSENSDVGSLQTILGNELTIDFKSSQYTNNPNIDCIGYFADTANNRIFLFFTDYTDTNPLPTYLPTASNYIYVYDISLATATKLVEGAFLNFSKNSPIIGVNLLEDLLFWTDYRNQPRKINVINAANSITYYTTEDQISVAKLSPVYAIEMYQESTLVPDKYETTMKDVTSEYLPPNGVTGTVVGAYASFYEFQVDIPFGQPFPIANQIVSGVGIPEYTLVISYNEITSVVTVTNLVTLTDGEEVKFNANPYYDPTYIGDPTFLEDKFVRFSYRYRFDDNEYSIYAPFTQIAYIPKQDGYFLYEESMDPEITEPRIDDEMTVLRSTIVPFMYNKVNNIELIVPLPCPANQLADKYKITEIDILYKESDGLAVQVVDIISVQEIAAQAGVNEFYVYNYQAKKPFKTLPERDLLRVYDRTPVKALGQEIISNRVVYSNYQDKQSYPQFLDYYVACTNKSPFEPNTSRTSLIEYPNHSVKQNRNYQVGVVLSDKFGRQSGVILSNAILPPGSELEPSVFVASSLFVPYKKSNPDDPEFPDGELVNEWPGYSLKVQFNNVIDSGGVNNWPGIYNDEITSVDYNPLGWYSYKIVVKQTEQDYYNVYAPGVMAAYPNSILQELGKTSHVVLMSDNINKVPRDLNEVSNTQEQYRSSVKLFSRVNNVDPATKQWTNQQYYPGNTFAFVNTIATNSSLFSPDPLIPLPAGYEEFYQVDSNPLIARLATEYKIGVTSNLDVINLAILETNPTTSRLDIYWETTTAGIISELNQAILENSNGPANLAHWNFNLEESFDLNSLVVEDFYFTDISGDIITTITLANINLTITNLLNQSRNSKFIIEDGSAPGKFNIRTAEYFYYNGTAETTESYKFAFQVTVGTSAPVFNKYGALDNVVPTITEYPTDIIELSPGTIDIYQFEAVNGSNPLGGQSGEDITWTIYGTYVVYFTISSTGLLQQPGLDVPEGLYELTVRATDAGGLYTETSILFSYGANEGYVITVTSGGPFVNQTQNSGEWAVTGYIEILSGYNFKLYAGSYPYTIGLNSVNTTINFPDIPLTITKNAPNGASGGLSSTFLTLVSGNVYYFVMSASFGGAAGGTSSMVIVPA